MANNENTELEAADLLTGAGIQVKIGRRDYRIKELTLGMLDEITALRLKMNINEDGLQNNPIAESNQMVHDNIHLAAKMVAIGIIGRGKIKRRLLTNFFARRLMEQLTSATLYEAVLSIIKLSNVGDFTNSIRLAAGIRMTAPDPDLVETT